MMKKLILNIYGVGLLIVLAACSPKAMIKPEDKALAYQHYVAALQPWNDWQLQARISIKTPDERVTANLKWQYSTTEQEFLIYDSLGTSHLQMQYIDGLYHLKMKDGKEYVDANGAALLQHFFGWRIPIDRLPRWIRAELTTEELSKKILNDEGLLSQFSFQDWQVEYKNYRTWQATTLPKKITITNKEHQIKLVIRNWILVDKALAANSHGSH